MRYTPVTYAEFAAMEGLDDWRANMGAARAEFAAPSFAAGAGLVAAIAAAADAADHHPEVSLRYPGRVRVVLSTHATGGLSDADVSLARTISELARDAGATAHPHVAEVIEIAIDTMDAARIRPFWAAVLGYPDSGGSLTDPAGFGPPVWFQQMDEPRTERNRFHIDITVAHDIAEQRVAAAIAAGGHLVTDQFARSWWVLADADGNEACICTWQDR
ncbi:MAG: 4a-hydroxytetrahydrobiopterin dehydratase [Ilumatobacter sp.]|nr:4a-hydroxytetrahydrobiopterin dehydratase [Ilumatobacter sp.]